MNHLMVAVSLALLASPPDAAPVAPYSHLTPQAPRCADGAPCRLRSSARLLDGAWTLLPPPRRARFLAWTPTSVWVPTTAWLVPRPVPSVVNLQAIETNDALAEDSCLGWHAQAVANPQRLRLRWLTVDQATVAALQPGRCNTTIGLDLARLRLLAP